MKILFPFIGDTIGGSHISAVDYIIELKKKKIDVQVLLFKKKSYLEKYLFLKKVNFDVINLPVIKIEKNIFFNFFFLIIGFFKARTFLKKNKITIVHTNDIRNHYCWSIWTLFLVKHIWHQRTIWPNSIQFNFFIILANKVFCNSSYLYKKIKFNFIKKKSFLVSNIINLQKKFKFKQKDKLIVGFFSNIQNIKRPDIMIYLLKQTALKKINLEIRCFGTDKYSILKNYSQNILYRKYFKYYGHKINILRYMKQCNIIIATSDNDALGRTILEGMSLGIPTIATNRGGHKYIIKNNINGYLFDPKKDDLLKKILFINKNKLINKKIINNGRNYIKHFSREKIIKKLIMSYEN